MEVMGAVEAVQELAPLLLDNVFFMLVAVEVETTATVLVLIISVLLEEVMEANILRLQLM
jgi:hypothetical protein